MESNIEDVDVSYVDGVEQPSTQVAKEGIDWDL